ncbi:MAG: hypothetical protein RLN90_15335 [Balneolaceae bacterium]
MNKLVICFSTASLNAEIWTNKQHLMTRLSKIDGYEVIYIDQGMSKAEIAREFKRINLGYFLNPVRKISKNLTSISPYFLPLLRGGKLKEISWNLLWDLFLKKYINDNFDEIIIWTYQPQSWYLIKKLRNFAIPFKFIYDCVDDFKSQPAYKNNKARKDELIKIEGELVKQVNLVVTTSEKLYEDKIKLNKNTHYVHNVGDFDHFNSPENLDSESAHFLNQIDKEKIVYAGVIDDYKIDLELIVKTAVYFADKVFILIGPVRVPENHEHLVKLRSLKNVYFLGLVKYQILPTVLHKCDTIWLPYNNNEHTRYVFPLKLFEAFATGKKIIAKSLQSYKAYHHLMITFDSFEDLKIKFENKNYLSQERIEVAAKNSWESRLSKIIKLLEN